MAAIDIKSDEQVLDALDFDHKPGCDMRTCPMAATFVLICRGCSYSEFACTTHYLRVKSLCDAAGGCCCSKCAYSGLKLIDIANIIPIDGRS